MLIGREAECRRLEDLLARALSGTSGTLVIRGEAGMDKTALLAFARDRGDGWGELDVPAARTKSRGSARGGDRRTGGSGDTEGV